MNVLESLCTAKGLRMTRPRRLVARVLLRSADHPDVQDVYARARALDDSISLATVYRTLRIFEQAGLLIRHDFGGPRARYEYAGKKNHAHLIDLESGKVIEFSDQKIEKLQSRIAARLGYRLVSHRLELYGKRAPRRPSAPRRKSRPAARPRTR